MNITIPTAAEIAMLIALGWPAPDLGPVQWNGARAFLPSYLPSHKADEHYFWGEMLKAAAWNRHCPDGCNITARDIISRPNFLPAKRALGMLEKWCDGDLYEYGVTLDLGWITPRGLAIVPRLQLIQRYGS